MAVCHLYGWNDIDLGHGFHRVPYLSQNDQLRFTICDAGRLELLRRLAHLNRERYAIEVQGQAKIELAAARTRPAGSPRRGRPVLHVVKAGLFDSDSTS